MDQQTKTRSTSLFERFADPLIGASMIAAVIVFSQALSFSMPGDNRDDAMHFLRSHAWLLAVGAAGLLFAGRVVTDLLKRVAELERRLEAKGPPRNT